MSENINQKSLNNAAISYGMLFISWLLFFNKKNPYINNSFVKNHIKTSIVLHMLLLLNYITFIWFGLFKRVGIFGFSLNIIIADIFFFVIGFFIIKGIFDALSGREPNIGSAIKTTTSIGLDINNDNTYDEKDKLGIIFSYIPFAGYIVSSKYENERIQNILKLNIWITLFICFVYILRYNNVANLLMLIYIIYIVFGGAYLYTKDTLVSLTLPDYLLPNILLVKIKSFSKYLFYYFSGNFKNYKNVEEEEIAEKQEDKNISAKELEKKEDLKLSKNLIYIPIINLIFLFQKENKYTIHIRNGITITFLFLFTLILFLFGSITGRPLILFLFPICFGIGLLSYKYYKMPFIYEIYSSFAFIKDFIFKSKQKIDEKRKEVNEVSLKVPENKINENKETIE